jgi:predicted ATPase
MVKVNLADLKGFAPGELTLGRMAVFVGPNAVGKTQLLSSVAEAGRVPVVGFRSSVHPKPPESMLVLDEVGQARRRVLLNGTAVQPVYHCDNWLFVLDVLYSIRRGATLAVIDGMEGGLHMGAQYRLMREVQAVMEQKPDLTVLLSTHSPYLLESVRAQDIHVMDRGPDGLTRVKPLPLAPGFARWSTSMTAGELWACCGEAWVSAEGDVERSAPQNQLLPDEPEMQAEDGTLIRWHLIPALVEQLPAPLQGLSVVEVQPEHHTDVNNSCVCVTPDGQRWELWHGGLRAPDDTNPEDRSRQEVHIIGDASRFVLLLPDSLMPAVKRADEP